MAKPSVKDQIADLWIQADRLPDGPEKVAILVKRQRLIAASSPDVTYDVEYTDTFGGQANYSWVRRVTVKGSSTRPAALVRRAKAALGLSGVRCRSENQGDTIELRPIGGGSVIFITYHDGPEDEASGV